MGDDDSGSFTCQVCGKEFGSQRGFAVHTSKVHKGNEEVGSILEGTIEEVKEEVEDYSEDHGAGEVESLLYQLIEEEAEGKERKTLLEWLEERLAEREEREEEEAELVLDIGEIEVVRETPMGEQKLQSTEDIEIPLVPVKQEVEHEQGRELSLRSVRDYVDLDFRSAVEEAEEESVEEVEKRGIIRKLLGFKGKTVEKRTGKTRELVRNRIRSTKAFPDDIGTVALGFYLKEFLEVVLEIDEELTYERLAEEMAGEDMEGELRSDLRTFFETLSHQIYEGRITLDYDEAYELADRTMETFLSGED